MSAFPTGPFRVSSYGEEIGEARFTRQNDGSMVILGRDEDGDGVSVLTVIMQKRAKRGEAWRTTDRDQEAFAAHVVRLLNANPFDGSGS